MIFFFFHYAITTLLLPFIDYATHIRHYYAYAIIIIASYYYYLLRLCFAIEDITIYAIMTLRAMPLLFTTHTLFTRRYYDMTLLLIYYC